MSSGNYSVVKLAVEKGTGKEWAAKIITKKDAGPKGLQMLQTEVDILSSCEHPNIVRLSEVFETDEHYYIIMELYTTLTLSSFLHPLLLYPYFFYFTRNHFYPFVLVTLRCHSVAAVTCSRPLTCASGSREVSSSTRSYSFSRIPSVMLRVSFTRSSAPLRTFTIVRSFTAVRPPLCLRPLRRHPLAASSD